MLSGVLAEGRARFSVPHPIQTQIYTKTFANSNLTAPPPGSFPSTTYPRFLFAFFPSPLVSFVAAAVNFTVPG